MYAWFKFSSKNEKTLLQFALKHNVNNTYTIADIYCVSLSVRRNPIVDPSLSFAPRIFNLKGWASGKPSPKKKIKCLLPWLGLAQAPSPAPGQIPTRTHKNKFSKKASLKNLGLGGVGAHFMIRGIHLSWCVYLSGAIALTYFPAKWYVSYKSNECSIIHASVAVSKEQRESISLGDHMFELTKYYSAPELEACENRRGGYGLELIENWRKSHLNLCSGYTVDNSSSIDCYLKADAPVPMNLCTTSNSQIDLGEDNVKIDKNFRVGNRNVEPGSVKVDCQADRLRLLPRSQFPTSTGAWFLDGLLDSQSLKCSQRADYPLFLITRWRATNPFHILEDLSQTFISMMVLRKELRVKDTQTAAHSQMQIIFVDDLPEGPWFDAWQRLFYTPKLSGRRSYRKFSETRHLSGDHVPLTKVTNPTHGKPDPTVTS